MVAAMIYAKLGWFDLTTYDDSGYYGYCLSLAKLPALDVIKHLFTDVTNNNWHPVTVSSFYLFDHLLFDLDAGASHLINVFIHLLNIIFVYLVVRKLNFTSTVALFTAFLFALHPLQVEAVAWIGERKGLLAALFMFLSILTYIKFKESGDKKKYIFSIIYFLLGMMSKVSIVTFPALLVILSHHIYKTPLLPRQNGCFNRSYIEALPFVIVSLIIAPILIYTHYETGALGLMRIVGTLERFHNFVNSVRIYLTQIIYPDEFSIVYLYKLTIPLKLLIPSYFLFTSLIVAAAYGFFRKKELFLGLGWFFIMLFPLSGLIQTGSHPHADRYMYISSIGIFLLIGMAMTWLLHHAKRTKYLLVTLLFFAMVISTYINILKWKNTLTLFQNSVETIGDTYMAHSNLAYFYFHFNQIIPAMKEYELMRENDYKNQGFYIGLIADLYRHNNLATAEIITRDAIETFGGDKYAYPFIKYLGLIQTDKKEYVKAIHNLNICLKIAPKDAETYYFLGVANQKMGKTDVAKTYFNTAHKYNKNYPSAVDAIQKLENEQDMSVKQGD